MLTAFTPGPSPKSMGRFAVWGVVLAALSIAQVHAQSETVQLKRPTQLRASPAPDAAGLALLPAQTAITRLPVRQGAWIQVRTSDGTAGWIHLFDVGNASTPSTVSSTATGALRGLSNFFNRGSAQSSGAVVATTTVGIRGLGSEDIANAQPNLAALAQAEGMRLNAVQARRFATESQLAARAVEDLPAPPAPTAAPEASRMERIP